MNSNVVTSSSFRLAVCIRSGSCRLRSTQNLIRGSFSFARPVLSQPCRKFTGVANVIPNVVLTVPPSLAIANEQLSKFDEIKSAQQSISRGTYASARASLLRALDIVHAVPDSTLSLSVLRLLSYASHCEGAWSDEVKDREMTQSLTDQASKQGLNDETLLFQSLTSLVIAYLQVQNTQAALDVLTNHIDHYKATPLLANYLPALYALQGLAYFLSANNAAIGSYQKALEQLSTNDTAKKSAPTSTNSTSHSSISPIDANATTVGAINSVTSSPLSLTELIKLPDVHLLLGDYYANIEKDQTKASTHYQTAVTLYNNLPSTTLTLPNGSTQIPLVFALLRLGDEASMSKAIQLTESLLGNEHPFLAYVLYICAGHHARMGDAITSEGLYRSAITKLQSLSTTSAPTSSHLTLSILHTTHVPLSHIRLLLLDSMYGYAQLLNRLEWNGKSRSSEGEYWINKIKEFEKQTLAVKGRVELLMKGTPLLDMWGMVNRFIL